MGGSPAEHVVLNPADERAIATVPLAGLEETDAAIARARDRRAGLARPSAPGDRARLLRRFADAVDARIEELAQLEVANAGHTISNARWEAGNVRDVLAYYAGAPERHSRPQIPVAGGVDITFHEPLGVVGVIVPWNFPMPIAGWGFGPALAAGNTVVLKPAELTPLTAMRVGELALEAGIPEDVLQVVPGKGSVVGAALRRRTRRCARSASPARPRWARQIMAGCAEQVKRVTLELGGKSANIVFADADLDRAAASAPLRGVRQRRPGLLRALARSSSSARLRRSSWSAFEAAVRGREGHGPDRPTTAEMGPLITRRAARRRRRATSRAPTVAFRGSAPQGPGYWLPADGRSSRSRPRRAGVPRGDLRARRRGGPLRRRGRGDRDRQRQRRTGCRARSGPRDLGRALRVARARRDRRTCR